MHSIVVHYQEIALKGKNRPWFVGRLVRNLRGAVSDLDVKAVRSLMGRIEIVLGPGATREEVGERIRRTFGIANFSYAGRTPLDLDALDRRHPAGSRRSDLWQLPGVGTPGRQALSPDIAAGRAGQSAGASRRRAAGRSISKNADLVVHVELLSDEAFYCFGKERGAGGLPTGTAGRVACLLSGGIDSPVAAHRMMKRGCTVTFVHFHSYPILSRASQEKARELVTLLTRVAAALAVVSRRVR